MKLRYCLFPILWFLFPLLSYADSPPDRQPLSIVSAQSRVVLTDYLPIGGTVAANRSVVLAAQIPGRVTRIAGEEGDRFQEGSLLVKINDDALRAQRQTAIVQYYAAVSAAGSARAQLHRKIESPSTSNPAPGGMGLPKLFDQIFTKPFSDAIGAQDSDVERHVDLFSTRSQADQAHHTVEQVLAQIRQIDSKLRDSVGVAPFDGTIITKQVEVGDTVQPGQPLLEFGELDTLKVRIDVPESLIHYLQEGQSLNIQGKNLKTGSQATVSRIFPTADPVRHTTPVELTIFAIQNIAPGNYVEVQVPLSKDAAKKQVLVPVTAVMDWGGGLSVVYIVNKSERVIRRLVRIGDILPSGEVTILFGVKAGERVIDQPPSNLKSGFLASLYSR